MGKSVSVSVDGDPEQAIYAALDRTVGLESHEAPLSKYVDVEALTNLVGDGEVFVTFSVWGVRVAVTPAQVAVYEDGQPVSTVVREGDAA
jgi:hypothetical protein